MTRGWGIKAALVAAAERKRDGLAAMTVDCSPPGAGTCRYDGGLWSAWSEMENELTKAQRKNKYVSSSLW